MPLTPQITITGNLQQVTGVIDSGSVQFELVNFGSTVPRVSGTAILVVTSFRAQADGSGNFSVTLWGTDVITPSTVFYSVTFYSDTGAPVMTLPYQFTGSGAFDISQIVPMGQTVVAAAQPTSAVPQIFTPLTHQFLTGMNSLGLFSSGQPAFTDISGVASASQLPTPTASTLGGVKSLAAVSSRFLTSIGTDGVPVASTIAYADLTGTVVLPNPSPTTLGGIESFVAQSHKWINAISTSGVPSATQPAAADLSDGTTGSGAVVLANTPTLITPVLGAATGTSLTTTGIIKSQAGGAGTSSGLQVSAGNAALLIQNTGGTADNKIWDIATSGSQLLFRHINDALSIFGTYMTVTRSGGSNTSVQFGAGGGTQTLPTATDTLVGKATTDIFTNKTLDTAGTGNVFKINGTAISAVTGSGSVVLATSPTISSPVISGTITSYNSITTSGNGVAAVIGTPVDVSVATAFPGSGTMVASAPAGMYLICSSNGNFTQTAGSSAGTMQLTVDGATVASFSLVAGTSGQGINFFNVIPNFISGGSINWSATISGAGNAGTFNCHIRLIYLG